MAFIVLPGDGSQTWKRINLEAIMMQSTEGNNSCGKSQKGPAEWEHLTQMEAGESQRRFLQGSGGGGRDICQEGLMMGCTEGGESGTGSAFWETLWGVVVSADAVRGSRVEGVEPGLGWLGLGRV